MIFTPEQRKAAMELAQEMPALHDRLMRAGLYRTAKKFQEGAMNEIGYEVAEIAERTDRQSTNPAARP